MQYSNKRKYLKYKNKYQNEKRNIITNILKNQKGGAAQSLLEDLIGPITQSIMIDPVIASDGFTYERSAILQVIRRGGDSPMTREAITANLKPNRRLKSIIEKLIEKRLLEQSVIDEYNQEKREMEARERGAREARERRDREVRERREREAREAGEAAEREAREAAEREAREAAEREAREGDVRERRENQSNQLRNFLQENRNLTADNIDYILNNVLNEVNHRRLSPNTIELLIVHLRQNPNINEVSFANLVRVIDSYMSSEQRVRDNLRIFLQDNGGDISNAEIRRILNRIFIFIRQNGLNLNDVDELINHLAQRNREEFQQNIENNIMNFLEERVEQQQQQQQQQQEEEQQQQQQLQQSRDRFRSFLDDNLLFDDDIDRVLNTVFNYIDENLLNDQVIIPELINHLREYNLREENAEYLQNIAMIFLRNRNAVIEQRNRDNFRMFLEDNTNLSNVNINRILVNVFTYINDNGLVPNLFPELRNFIRNLDNLRNLEFDDLFGDIMVHLRSYIPIRNDIEPIINDIEPIINDIEPIINDREIINNIRNDNIIIQPNLDINRNDNIIIQPNLDINRNDNIIIQPNLDINRND
jgi:hypothetical protein